jgi:hypothetical protein
MAIVFVFDATHEHINAIPQGALAALYTTGSPDIKATAADFGNHPHAIHICQDHGSDLTADILDMEAGAASPSDCAVWIPRARNSFNSVHRPDQRWPGIYASKSRVTEVANALVNAKITNVPLWVAHWGEPQNQAIDELMHASGPFPIVGMQIANQGARDFSVFSGTWVNNVAVIAKQILKPPPGQWRNAREWTWKQAITAGVGLDGKLHGFIFNPATGDWSRQA